MSTHATFSELLPEDFPALDDEPSAEAYRRSLATLTTQLKVTEPSSSALLLSRALELVTEAEQMLADQRARIVQLERLSVTDELTELFNRRGFLSQMQRQFALAKRHGETGVLAMLDLDGFKAINDRFGHPVGDRALVAVGARIKETLRETDIVARLGGDEFAIGLTQCSVAGGMEKISHIEMAIAELAITAKGQRVMLGASIGAAPYDGSQKMDDVISQADHALYAAKSRQRTRRRAR